MCREPLIAPLEQPLESVERIAVLRANGLGDYLFAEPALRSLKAAYPAAELVLIGAPWHARTLLSRPGPVDRVEVAPALPGIRDPESAELAFATEGQLCGFLDRLRSLRFDLGIQMHGGGKNSNPFMSRIGAGTTVGLATADAEKPDRWLPYHYYQPEVTRYLEVAALAGAPPVSLVPRWSVTQTDRVEAERVLGGDDGRPIVALCPGAGDPRRRWDPSSFAEVAAALAARGVRLFSTGSEAERAVGRAVVAAADAKGADVLDLTGRMSLGGLSAALERSALVVANDSGTLHLARAVGAPTVAIYWCGNLINAGPLAHARHRTHPSWRLNCPVCGVDCTRETCDHEASFVDDVASGDVIDDCLDLLDREPHSRDGDLPAPPESPRRDGSEGRL